MPHRYDYIINLSTPSPRLTITRLRGGRVYRKKNGVIVMQCYEGHLEGFKRFAELADAIEKWLEEAGR
jgi:hypothetical protein